MRLLLVLLAALALATPALAAKDDTYVAYLNGTNLADLGTIASLNSVPVTAAVFGTAFFTITDFGSGKFGWTADIGDALTNGNSWGLYYVNATNSANPPLLLDLTAKYTVPDDSTPFGQFNTTHLNTALAAIGLPSTPVLSLAFGRNLLTAWKSSDGKAIVGVATNDTDVGPPPPDFEETDFTATVDDTTLTFPGFTGLVNASAVLSIVDNLDGTYAFDLFTTVEPYGIYGTRVGSTLSLVYVEFGGAVKTGFTFPLSARAWLKASKDDGYSSTFTKAALLKSLWKSGVDGDVNLYVRLDVSDIVGDYVNFGAFDPAFALDATAPEPPSPPPRRSPPPPAPLKGIYTLQNVKTKAYLTYGSTVALSAIPPAKKQRSYWSLATAAGATKLSTVSLDTTLGLAGSSTGVVSLGAKSSSWRVAPVKAGVYTVALKSAAAGKPRFLGAAAGNKATLSAAAGAAQQWRVVKA